MLNLPFKGENGDGLKIMHLSGTRFYTETVFNNNNNAVHLYSRFNL